MYDITYCLGKGCTVHKFCLRHVNNAEGDRVSISVSFVNPDGSCDYMIPDENYNEDESGGYGDNL